MLTPVPPGYSERTALIKDLLPWQVPLATYSPNPALEKDLDLFPSMDELSDLQQNRNRLSYEGHINFDNSDRSLNPIVRTGLYAKGHLWNWGPNQAADALIIYRDSDSQQVYFLAIQRKNGSWAIPGGFKDKGENSTLAALRELQEEALIINSHLQSDFINKTTCIYAGYADDPRNTDNAWIETSVHFLPVTADYAKALILRAAADAQAVKWQPASAAVLKDLYSNHAYFVKAATKLLTA